jgi:hypothetical protein
MLMTVGVHSGPSPVQLSGPRPLFRMPQESYEVSPNGERFLMPMLGEPASSVPLDVVVNWASEIQR